MELPTGIPDHVFSFPETYGGSNMGLNLKKGQIEDVAEVSGLLNVDTDDFIDSRVKTDCQLLIPNPTNIESKNIIEAFRFLKLNVKSVT